MTVLRFEDDGPALGDWKTPFRKAAGAGKAVGRGIKRGAGAVSPPWSGTRIGTKGWVTRLGERMSAIGVPGVGVVCSLKKYRNSRACKMVGKVAWAVGKRAVEKAYGLPDGSLDQAEGVLNQVGKDDPRFKRLPPDVQQLMLTQRQDPTWWEQILDSLGLR